MIARPQRTTLLHDQFCSLVIDGVLALLQVVLHQVESVDAVLKAARELAEKRRYLGILEVLETGDDVIALFAGAYQVNEILQPRAAQPEAVDALRKHAGKK